MSDVLITEEGHAGLITLNRAAALNALTWEMVLEIERALDRWRDNPGIRLVLMDAAGDRAFCAGGDIAEMYASGRRGDVAYGQRFWRDEYRLNAKIAGYTKPIVTFLQGFTMGGGVGLGCHASHRIVTETSKIAMPECGIGLVPDVGGSLLLKQAPAGVGGYLGLSGDRMDAADALYAGFADHLVPQDNWARLKAALIASGDPAAVTAAAAEPPPARLADWQPSLARLFAGAGVQSVWQSVTASDDPAAARAAKLMARNAPLAMACAWGIQNRLTADSTITEALGLEFRYTARAVSQGDFIEGIRAAIIDKDRNPVWQHGSLTEVTEAEITRMLAPLPDDIITGEDIT